MDQFAVLNRYHISTLTYFIDKLKKTPDGDGTLLDHSIVVYGSGLSDGNRHTHTDLPVVLVGHGGDLRMARHVAYAKDTPMTNLYLTLLDRMGVHPESIGDSTGELEELVNL
jgi:hypothetical protein